MNIFLWIVQVLLAGHTAVGAVWKFSHTPEQTMPPLKAIPRGAWLAMSVIELLCSVGLLLPAVSASLGTLVPIAATIIVLEMLLFCVLHMVSGDTKLGPMLYWLVVAVVCAFIAYGRIALLPF